MPRFRKRPVEIEARQWHGGLAEDAHALAMWCRGRFGVDAADEYLVIDTLEGAHKARPGDWIIRGVANEFYPCKPEIFAATYDPVAGGNDAQ